MEKNKSHVTFHFISLKLDNKIFTLRNKYTPTTFSITFLKKKYNNNGNATIQSSR